MIRAALAACVAGLVVPGVVAGGDAGPVQGFPPKATVFHDAVGESPAGPDITTVVVSSDVNGSLTIRVDLPSNLTLTEDLRVRIWLDSDDDPATGLAVEGLEGFDAFLLLDRWELGLGVPALFRCDGSTCSGDVARPPASLGFAYANGATFTLDPRDLGLPRFERVGLSVLALAGIAFDPLERRYDLTHVRQDYAPGQGLRWTYDARVVRVTSFAAVPATPKAGSRFTLRLTATRTDSGAAVTSGAVRCSTRIAGKLLRPLTRRFVQARAVCVFDIPAAAQGKSYRSTIAIRARGATATRSISGTVR